MSAALHRISWTGVMMSKRHERMVSLVTALLTTDRPLLRSELRDLLEDLVSEVDQREAKAARKAKLDEERDVIDAAIVDEIESDEHGAHESAPADTPDEADALPGAGVFTAPAAVEAAEAGESRD